MEKDLGKDKSPFDELLISTGVDRLIKFVHEKKRVDIEDAATKLNLPFKTIEQWAKSLEAQGLIRIEYKFTKEFLVWTGDEEQIIEKIGDIGAHKKYSEQKIQHLMTKIKTANVELDLLKKQYIQSVHNVEPMISETSKKIGLLSKSAKNSEQIYKKNVENLRRLCSEYTRMRKMGDKVRVDLAEIKKEVHHVSQKSSIRKMLDDFDVKLGRQHDDINKKLKTMHSIIEQHNVKLKHFEDVNKKFVNAEAGLRQTQETQKKIKKMITELENSYKEFNKISKGFGGKVSFKRKVKKYKTQLKDVSVMLNKIENKVSGLRKEIDTEQSAADTVLVLYNKISKTNFADMLSKVKENQRTLGDEMKNVSEFFKQIQSSKDMLNQINATLKEVKLAESKIKSERVKVSDTFSKMSGRIKKEIRGLSVYDEKLNRISKSIDFMIAAFDRKIFTHKKYLNQMERDKITLGREMLVNKKEVDAYIKRLRVWNNRYREVLSKKSMLSQVSATITSIREDTKDLEQNLGLIKKKITLLNELKGRPDEQYAVLRFIEDKLMESKIKEDKIEGKRRRLKKIIDEMWKDGSASGT